MTEEKIVEKLPEILKGKHGRYFLCERDNDVAIYSKDFPREDARCFEVFYIRKIDGKKAAESFNKRFGASYDVDAAPDIKEKYPSDEDFGSLAWTYGNFDMAKKKFNLLQDEIIMKKKDI